MGGWTPEDFQRLQILTTLHTQEQTFFWTRFAGFATLNGGLLVLSTSSSLASSDAKFIIILLAFLLAGLWEIQFLSLNYVDRWKDQFHDAREKLEIVIDQRFRTSRLLSSTDLAVAVPVIVIALWLLLCLHIYPIGKN